MKTHIRTKNVPSSKPYLVCGILWAILAFVFPMYKLSSYLLIAGIDIFAYLAMRKFKVFKDIVIQYEEEIPFETITKDVSKEGTETKNAVLQQGVNGLKEIKYKVKYQNDIEISRTVIKEEIIKNSYNLIKFHNSYIKIIYRNR